MKTIVITGASQGIGKSLAYNLGKNNNLILLARTEDKLVKIKEELESNTNNKI